MMPPALFSPAALRGEPGLQFGDHADETGARAAIATELPTMPKDATGRTEAVLMPKEVAADSDAGLSLLAKLRAYTDDFNAWIATPEGQAELAKRMKDEPQ